MSRDVRQAIAGYALRSAFGPLRHHLLIGRPQLGHQFGPHGRAAVAEQLAITATVHSTPVRVSCTVIVIRADGQGHWRDQSADLEHPGGDPGIGRRHQGYRRHHGRMSEVSSSIASAEEQGVATKEISRNAQRAAEGTCRCRQTSPMCSSEPALRPPGAVGRAVAVLREQPAEG